MGVYIQPNHRIEARHIKVFLEVKDRWYQVLTPEAIEPDERRWLGPGIEGRWEDVTRIQVKTLQGSNVRVWLCERNATRHDFEARLECSIQEEQALPDLTSAEAATLWVYMADKPEGRRIDMYIRSEHDDLGRVTVHVDFRSGLGNSSFCLHNAMPGGVSQRMACGGNASGNNPGHADAERVSAGSAFGLLQCQKHRDSDPERSIWACEPW